ncbi:PEP-CTERM sorting domain-containing protein [Microcystis aeruginosa]|uniref:Ice-binding protein C-terminal domain-containing protein n=1 Tax=Microcystis aeruginosa 11-30S32 TaxID=2358142 RepID=A0A510PN12_MICAE|nr:PEP-CTERM sorting domain-containing protein [Microcystis aeruginosa]GCA95226.1 hypothetical protein MAE30S32_38780 [Microcystis aeruginosa 11-30S32]
MMTTNKLTKILSGVAVLGAATATVVGITASPSHAAVKLADLLVPGASFTVDDKLFTDFFFQPTEPAGGCLIILCGPVDAAAIMVGPATTAHGPGLKFTGLFFAEGGVMYDIALGYTVEVLDPHKWIRDIHMTVDGTMVGEGDLEIIETVRKPDDTVVGQCKVDNHTYAGLSCGMDLIGLHKKLKVRKDIELMGFDHVNMTIPEHVSFSILDQEFSQTTPEPGTILGLLAVGGLGLVSRLKKQK